MTIYFTSPFVLKGISDRDLFRPPFIMICYTCLLSKGFWHVGAYFKFRIEHGLSVLFPSFDFFEVRDVTESCYTDSRLPKFPHVIFEDKFIINYERNINSSLLLLTLTRDNVGNEANADKENQERDVVGLEMKLAQAKTSLGETSGSLIRVF